MTYDRHADLPRPRQTVALRADATRARAQLEAARRLLPEITTEAHSDDPDQDAELLADQYRVGHTEDES